MRKMRVDCNMKIYTKRFLLFIFIAISTNNSLEARDEEWLLKSQKKLDLISGWTRAQKLDELGKLVGGLNSGKMNANQNQIFERAQKMILDTPAYSDYYKEYLIEWNTIATKDGPTWSGFAVGRAKIISCLSSLGTPESVEALAGLLDCDETRNVPMEGGPLSQEAAHALSGMIENPPAKLNPIPWREWRDRVASGKQTFQLKGSPVRYNFDGPVAEVAQPASQTRFHGTQVAAAPEAKTLPRKTFPWGAGITLAIVIGGLFCWLKFRPRDQRRN